MTLGEIAKGNFRTLLLLYMAKQLQAPPYMGLVPGDFFESASGWIRREGVTPNYTRDFRPNMAYYYDTCKMWESCGVLERNGMRGGFIVTPRGEALLSHIGDDWRRWPIIFTVVLEGGKIELYEPVYAEENSP